MKNKFKTLLTIILAGLILITLTGCGNKEETDKKKDNNEKESQQVEANSNELKIGLGKWEDDVYTNEDLQIKFTLPTDWEAATDKDIARLMKLGEDVLADERKYISEVAKLSSVYYASATDTNTGSNIIIMSEKATMSLDEYMDALKSQLIASTDEVYKVEKEGTENLGQKEYSSITLSEAKYGLDRKYYVFEKDEAFIVIMMTSTDGEITFNKLAENFE